MSMTRRAFLQASSAIAAAFGIGSMGIPWLRERKALAAEGAPGVIWLQDRDAPDVRFRC